MITHSIPGPPPGEPSGEPSARRSRVTALYDVEELTVADQVSGPDPVPYVPLRAGRAAHPRVQRHGSRTWTLPGLVEGSTGGLHLTGLACGYGKAACWGALPEIVG
jgi:hypothetical protein